jgi:hypothetical protein
MGNIAYRLGEDVAAASVLNKLEGFQSQDKSAETFERTMAHLRDNDVDPAAVKIRLGAALVFDPASETFSKNDSANNMLSRVYRHPFVVPPAGQV